MSVCAVKLDNVDVFYDKGSAPVLKGVSLEIPAGQKVSVIGANGSGKTTLLRAAAGMADSTGTAEVFGRDIRGMKRRELASYVSFMSSEISGAYDYSVRETVAMGRYIHRKGIFGRDDEPDTVDRVLEETGLSDISEKKISQLSGGQRQRVCLARVFAQNTPVIMLDEPMNYLDLKYQAELKDRLLKWQKGKTAVDGVSYDNTLIGVYHDISMARLTADSMILMKDGRAVLHEKTEDIDFDTALTDIYGMDVCGYMKHILSLWK